MLLQRLQSGHPLQAQPGCLPNPRRLGVGGRVHAGARDGRGEGVGRGGRRVLLCTMPTHADGMHACDPTNVSSISHALGPSKLSRSSALHPQGPHSSRDAQVGRGTAHPMTERTASLVKALIPGNHILGLMSAQVTRLGNSVLEVQTGI